jgi:hypothetical protein
MAAPLPRAMPIPKHKGELYFKGKEIEAFLLTFESTADGVGLSDEQKCRQLPRYVSRETRELIGKHPGVLNPTNFNDLKEALIKLYDNNDRKYHYTRDKLQTYCFKKRKMRTEADLDDYYRTFMTHVQNLTNNNLLGTRDRDDLFWKGIPEKVQKLAYDLIKFLPGFSETSPMEYTQVYAQLKTIFEPRRYFKKGTSNKASTSLSSKIKKHKTKATYFQKEDSDSDSDSEIEVSSSEDESSSSDSDADSDSDWEPKPKRMAKAKKVKILKRPTTIPDPEITNQIRELSRSFKDMQVLVANSLAFKAVPSTQYPQAQAQQRSSPATAPNSMPLRNNRFQNTNTASRSNLCWFCDQAETHQIGMRNCPDAQAMVRQGLIKYSLTGILVKADDSRLPTGTPGQGGIRQAIINELNHLKEGNSRSVGACNLVDGNGNSPFTAKTYAIEADLHRSSPAKGNQSGQRPHKTSFLPKQQVSVEIPRRFGPLNPANKIKTPIAVPEPAKKVPSPPRVPRQETPIPNHPPGILPASFLKDKVPEHREANQELPNIPIDTIEIEIDHPEKYIPKPSSAYRFTTDLQGACDEQKVVDQILGQKIEISIGDFLGTAIGPAKILASGLKLKREYTGKNREPFTINSSIIGVPYIDSDESDCSDASDDLDNSDDEVDTPIKSLTDRFYGTPAYKTNLVHTAGPKKLLLAMATGKISARVSGQSGTEELLALIDTGSEINLISREAVERLNIPMDLEGSEWSLQGINHGPEFLLGCCHSVPVEVGGKSFNHHFFVKNGTFTDHDMLLGTTWLADYKSNIAYDIDPEGKRTMTLQIQEKGSNSIINLQALIKGSRQQTSLVNSISVNTPIVSNIQTDPLQLPPDKEEVRLQQNLYNFYNIDATPSQLSLSGDSPSIPSIGKDLSEAI